MNKDQIEGAAKNLGGKVQEEVGKVIGSPGQRLQGLKNQVEGKTQHQLGNVEAAVKDIQKP